jgi:hypothetical protein
MSTNLKEEDFLYHNLATGFNDYMFINAFNPKPKSRGSKIKKKRIQVMFHNTRRKRKNRK